MEYINGRLQLKNVTLVAMTSVCVYETVQAMKYSMKGIDFGDAVLITHKKPLYLPGTIRYSHTGKLTTIDDFNYKMLYELGDHIHTEYAMIVHYDGFIVHPECFRDEFLEYDYIGAPWPDPHDDYTYRDINGTLQRVGNSVGIRSKRLIDYPKKAGIPFEADHGFFHEDGFICVKNRHLFEQAGMKIAPLEVARYFSHETMIPEIEGITPFAFHKWAGTNSIYPRFKGEPDIIKRLRKKLKKMGVTS